MAPLSPQMKQCWKEHSSPHQQQPQGLQSIPTVLGRVLDVAAAGSHPVDLLVDEAPVLDPLWSCWKQDFSPRAGWKGWDLFLEVWAKLPQTSPGINLPVLVRSSPVVLPG